LAVLTVEKKAASLVVRTAGETADETAAQKVAYSVGWKVVAMADQ